MANLQVSRIIEKMTVKDRGERYVATSDLLRKLIEDSLILDLDLELRLLSVILQLLDDVAGDVSRLAVQCLPLLVKKVGEEQIVELTKRLCDKMLHGKDQHRDTASLSLRTLVAQVAPSLVPSVLVTLTPQMMGGISDQGMSTGIKCECLEILCDVAQKYGSLMADHHEKLLNALLLQLECNQATVRKKTVTRIASLAPSLSDDLLEKATVEVLQNLRNKNAKSEITRTNIQMIRALCRAVGYRFGTHQGNTVPVLINCCTSASENDEELRKYSLQDPNFTDNMEEEIDNDTLEDAENDKNANEYTHDDDDASWKVRRAAAKCLARLIVSHSEMLSKLYQEACPKLIDRFKEREENVKMDVFNTFIHLLRQTGKVTKGQADTDESSPKWLLRQEVSKIVKSINRQLREKSVNTKVGAFSVLRELVAVLPDCLADHIGSLVPGIERVLNDESSTSNLKIEALVFTKLVLASLAPPLFHPYIETLSSPVLAAVSERFYKVTAEALMVCGELVRVVRPDTAGMGFYFKPFVNPMYNAIMPCLENQDQDQEVKECAITCMGLVISTFGDHLRAELLSCLPVLVDRMGNEITRLTAVKAFAVIATSPLHIDLSCVLDQLIAELTGFLWKANRVLGQATLVTMNTLVTTYGDRIGSDAYEVILVELSSLISVSDMHMTALALKLCCALMTGKSCSENIILAVRNNVLPLALTLVKSPLLQGQALLDLQKFFEALVYHAHTSFYTLLDSLLSCAKPSPQYGDVQKEALYSIAQCVAVLCLATGDQNCSSTVQKLMEILNDDSDINSAKKHLALLSLGEIGRRKDLSAHAGIETILIESFQSPFLKIKSATSYALGNIAVGNLSNYLPFILDQIDNQQENQYFLLHSLKEVIMRQSVEKADFQNSCVDNILALLFNHCESGDEAIRNLVAQCLGKMALIEPEKLIPALKARMTSPTPFTRATVVTTVKYSVVKRPEKVDGIIFPEISSFLMLINDVDPHVRCAAVSALSTFAHYKPDLIKGLLPVLLPLLYDQTVIKQALRRTVNLGPFNHIIDSGLELRKAAFQCVFTLLDNCLDQLHPPSFIVPFLETGLEDHYDLKMVCHCILSLLADKCPSSVLAALDSLVEPLAKTIKFNPKQDRNGNLIRSVLRAISSLDRIGGKNHSHKFKTFMESVDSEESEAEASEETYFANLVELNDEEEA